MAQTKITSADIKDGTVVNADINASAAIDATKIGGGAVSSTEFGYLDGVTSAIQTQLDAKTTAANIVENETPSGTVDGANATFTLAAAPSPAASLCLYKNGIRMQAGGANDYTLSTLTITFISGSIPQTGDILLADYRH